MPKTKNEPHNGPIRRAGPLFMLLLGLLLGLFAQPAARAVARTTTYEKLGVFTRVLTYVQNSYVEEVDPAQLMYGAIKGMMSTLDAHSAFLTPAEYEEMRIDTGGEFGGIGLEVSREEGHLVVVSPLDGTPAARTGLRAGDLIVSIDGQDASTLGLIEAVRLMRGPPGTEVVLEINRAGFSSPRKIAIEREHIRLNPVSAQMVDGYAVIRIRSFQERTDRYLRDSLAELTEQAGGSIPGLILDLRNNPGGLLDQSVAVADAWLSEGVIVTTRGRGTQGEVQRAHRAGTEPGYPLVVLVNEGSASASEIVAGALKDNGRAVLIGAPTFGKGSVQTVIDLDDGSGLKLTVARYFTPKGNPIGDGGVRPDVLVAGSLPALGVDGGEDEVADEEWWDRDAQLKAALDALRTWDIFRASEVAPRTAAGWR